MTTKIDLLSDCGVLITRPLPQGKLLGEMVEAQGGSAFVLPLLQIEFPDQTLDDFLNSDWSNTVELCIFVSRYAVEGVCQGSGLQFLHGRQIAAIGDTTAGCLEAAGVDVDYVPADSVDSEGLLAALANIDMKGKRVVIFRGQTGREILAEELIARGAEVRQVAVYRRMWSTAGDIQLLLNQWLGFKRRIITATSGALLMHLLQRVRTEDRARVLESKVVVLSKRVADICSDCGFVGEICITEAANNLSILQTMMDSAEAKSHHNLV